MLSIAWSLLGGWVLGLFGFKAVVTAGMLQIFGVTINTLGYYFLFGTFGALRRLFGLTRPNVLTNNSTNKATEDLSSALTKAIKNRR